MLASSKRLLLFWAPAVSFRLPFAVLSRALVPLVAYRFGMNRVRVVFLSNLCHCTSLSDLNLYPSSCPTQRLNFHKIWRVFVFSPRSRTPIPTQTRKHRSTCGTAAQPTMEPHPKFPRRESASTTLVQDTCPLTSAALNLPP